MIRRGPPARICDQNCVHSSGLLFRNNRHRHRVISHNIKTRTPVTSNVLSSKLLSPLIEIVTSSLNKVFLLYLFYIYSPIYFVKVLKWQLFFFIHSFLFSSRCPLVIMNLISSSDSMHLLGNSSPSMRDQPGNTTIAESAILGIVSVSLEQILYIM